MVASRDIECYAIPPFRLLPMHSPTIHLHLTSLATRKHRQRHKSTGTSWCTPRNTIAPTRHVPRSLILAQTSREAPFHMRQVATELWFQAPRTSRSACHRQAKNIVCKSRSRARAPAVRVRNVRGVVVVAAGVAVPKGAVGQVALYHCTTCAVWVVEVPAPGTLD